MSSYYVEPTPSIGTSFGFVGILAGIMIIVPAIISLLMAISMWKIFTKFGKPGWAIFVPIYNLLVLLEIVGKEPITILLLCIPFYNIYVVYTIYLELAKKFGKSSGFAILMLLVPYIAIPMLAFSKNSEIIDTEYSSITNTIENGDVPAVEPVAPVAPVMPAVESVAPVAPVMPAVEPVAPVAPVMPAVEPVAPVAPVVPAVEPVAPVAPVMPAVEPVAPVAPVMPAVEPVAPVAPVVPAVEPAAPVAPVMPAVEPVAPVAPVMPAVEPVAPVAPVMPAVEPVVPVAPADGQNPNGQF